MSRGGRRIPIRADANDPYYGLLPCELTRETLRPSAEPTTKANRLSKDYRLFERHPAGFWKLIKEGSGGGWFVAWPMDANLSRAKLHQWNGIDNRVNGL